MTREELKRQIRLLSSGTIANLIGDPRYSAIDAAQSEWLTAADETSENAIGTFKAWSDFIRVYKLLGQIKAAGLKAKICRISNYAESEDEEVHDIPGIMVEHDYYGPYPYDEIWKSYYYVKRLARAAGYQSEERGYFTGTLIYCCLA